MKQRIDLEKAAEAEAFGALAVGASRTNQHTHESLIPTSGENGISVRVIGGDTMLGSMIVRSLAKHTTSLVTYGITGLILEFDKAKYSVRLQKKGLKGAYAIAVQEQLAEKISASITWIESNPSIRPAIKEKTIERLGHFFDEFAEEIESELATMRRKGL